MRLVADEVFHPLGKIQPLLIGLNLPDQVDSSLTGVILPIARLEFGFVRRGSSVPHSGVTVGGRPV